jgi:hypothetical protein
MAFVINSLDTITQTLTGGPVSSQYILYANGRGQSYWGPSINQSTIDALSSYNNGQFQALSTSVTGLALAFMDLSTYTISTLNGQIVSTGQSLDTNIGLLNNQFTILSNTYSNQFQSLSNNLTTQVNDIYNSSIAIVESTLQAVSSISTFTNEIAAVQTSLNAAASSLSTAIAVTNVSTTAALTAQFNSTIEGAAVSTYIFTSQQISSLSTVFASKDSVNTFSTQINQALLSTATSLTSTIGVNYSTLYLDLVGFQASTLSTQTWAIGQLNAIDARLVPLEAVSTQLSSLIVAGTSSYVSPLFAGQDTKFSGYTSTLLSQISSVAASTLQNTQTISSISSFSYFTTSSLQAQINSTNANLSTLTYEFNVLTTSSILAGIYDTFLELQTYTEELINSTIESVGVFEDALIYSTTIQNTSTMTGFFNQFVSSTYTSTVSTVVPITIAYVSTLVSTLYSTGDAYLQSSFNSTIFGKTTEFNSTTTGLTSTILSSTTEQLNSSILSYLSAPTGLALNNFSTAGAQAISSFNGQGTTALNSQSTIFYSTYLANQSLFSTLSGGANTTAIGLSTLLSTYTTVFAVQSSSFTTSSIALFSTQNSQFISSLGGYGSTLSASVNSTNTAVLTAATAATNGYLSTLVISTNNTYNAFVNNLLSQTSSVALSSLYTVQNLTLTGSNYEGTMDMNAYRNFNVAVTAPLGAASNYRLNYASNNISALDYRKGIITVDVSTIGAAYSNNGGALVMDVYRWGIPTTVFGGVYPSISSADYTAMYEYTILNSIVYTNLLNVYPRLKLSALQFGATQSYNVFGPSGNLQSNFFWRGTPLRLQWSNYTHFPFGQFVGAPPYSPDICVDILSGTTGESVAARYGPYDLSVSTLTVPAPYITTGSSSNAVPYRIRTYFAGKQSEAQELAITVLVPKFQEVRLTPAAGKFLSLQEIQAWSDSGSNVFLNTTNIGLYGSVVGSNLALGGSNVTYGRSNAVDGNSATVVIGPTSVNVPDANAYLQLLPNLTTTTTIISSITVFNTPSACNAARGGGDGAAEMESTLLRANVLVGSSQYYSTFRLTTAAAQTFSF